MKLVKLLICLLVVGLIAFSWHLLHTLKTASKLTAATETDTAQTFEVIYDDTGYHPATLEIPVGSTVVFRNLSKIPMWTASDPHPTHTDFPAFDAHKNYLPGQSYRFQFTSLGTFGYHNHNKSLHRGIVRVVDLTHPVPNIDKTKESQRATRDKILALFKPDDPSSVYAIIDSIEGNNNLSRDCHDMAHDLGHRAYELYGFSTAMTFSDPNRLSHTSVDDICAGGYIHGILEELFLHQPELQKQPETVCSSVPPINRGSCFHDVGHGLMFVNQRNVPTSLVTCRQLSQLTDTHRCYEGVWMEMFWGDIGHAGADSLGWTLDKPLTPCVNATEDEKPACFLYAHLGYLRNHPKDFTGTINLCTQNKLNNLDEHYCLKGIGITMMKHFTSHNLPAAESLVAALRTEQKYAYYEGVISYARLSNVGETELQHFCSLLKKDSTICTEVLKNTPK